MNKKLRLKRVSEHPDVTAGVLINDDTGLPICFTLEKAFRWNEKNISCIPKGTYACVPYSSDSYPDCYMVTEVHGRSGILFHIGNRDKDTEGCILPGMQFGELDNEPAVLRSGDAMGKIRQIIGQDRFVLVVE